MSGALNQQRSSTTRISGVVTALYVAYLLAPMLLILIGSFGKVWSNTLLPTGATGRWYVEVATSTSFQKAFLTSLTVCMATVVVCIVLGAPLAYAVASAASRKLRIAARICYLLPVAAPAVVLGFGFMLVFSSDTLPFLGSTWLLVVAHVVLCLPYMLQTLVSDIRHQGIDKLEQAAESLGASFVRRFLDVVLPSLRHSIMSGSIMVAALSIGEFQLSNLIAGFLNRTYPIVLLQAFYGATGLACAATMVLLLLALMASLSSSLGAKGAHTSAIART